MNPLIFPVITKDVIFSAANCTVKGTLSTRCIRVHCVFNNEIVKIFRIATNLRHTLLSNNIPVSGVQYNLLGPRVEIGYNFLFIAFCSWRSATTDSVQEESSEDDGNQVELNFY